MVFKKTKESIKCKYCGSEHTVCNGNKYNKQRYVCKDCGKSFSREDNRLKHDNLERILALLLYANGMSLRSTQRVLESYFNVKIPFKLILDWIANMSKQLQLDIDKNNKKQKPKTIEILELDELYTYFYNLKKNKEKNAKYGLLLIETEVKLLHLI